MMILRRSCPHEKRQVVRNSVKIKPRTRPDCIVHLRTEKKSAITCPRVFRSTGRKTARNPHPRQLLCLARTCLAQLETSWCWPALAQSRELSYWRQVPYPCPAAVLNRLQPDCTQASRRKSVHRWFQRRRSTPATSGL